MVFGMSIHTYTVLHVVISLIGIASGWVVIWGMLTGRHFGRPTAIFLISTALTSVTGFGFPVEHLLPSHVVGAISLVLLAIAIPALYRFHLARGWRPVYIITASAALYLNVFVLIVQAFEKVPFLRAMAPTQQETPFIFAQLVVLVLFVCLTYSATKRFHVESPAATRTRLAA